MPVQNTITSLQIVNNITANEILGTKTLKEIKFMNGSVPSGLHLNDWEKTPHVLSHVPLKNSILQSYG